MLIPSNNGSVKHRVLSVVMLTVTLVLGGIWLSRTSQATTPPAGEAAAAPEVASATEMASAAEAATLPEIPEGFVPLPFLSEEPRQVFERAEWVLEEGRDYRAIIVTNRGTLHIDLFQDQTPITVNNFVFLARHRYYEGIVFHRVLEGFMAQTGDPTGTGTGGPGYQFADEIVPTLRHDRKGIVSMANAGPNTNGSQFFITFVPTPHLDGRHTVFGRVIAGLEVLDAITRIDPNQPSAVVRGDETLADLAAQGITLDGDPAANITAYLTERLGAEPVIGQTFNIDGVTAVAGRLGQTPAFGFYPQPDFIEQIIIIARGS